MNLLTARAKRLFDGTSPDLSRALSLEVTASLSSPAAAVQGSFLVDADPGKLGEILVETSRGVLLRGKVDRQQLTVSHGGLVLELEGRSRGALLLDNEAQPCSLQNVGLATVFSLFGAPRGFSCYNPNPAFFLGSYAVRAGTSEWEAIRGFARRAYGLTPYVSGEQVMVCRPGGTASITISNTGEGTPFTRLEKVWLPYKILSRVVMRDPTGLYSTAVENSAAPANGVERTRFIVPANEFVDSPAMDANQRIRASMLDSEEILVTLPGLVDVSPGQEAAIADKTLEQRNLLVEEAVWSMGGSGCLTRLRLVSNVYF